MYGLLGTSCVSSYLVPNITQEVGTVVPSWDLANFKCSLLGFSHSTAKIVPVTDSQICPTADVLLLDFRHPHILGAHNFCPIQQFAQRKVFSNWIWREIVSCPKIKGFYNGNGSPIGLFAPIGCGVAQRKRFLLWIFKQDWRAPFTYAFRISSTEMVRHLDYPRQSALGIYNGKCSRFGFLNLIGAHKITYAFVFIS